MRNENTMDTQDLMNAIYDLIAQNPIKGVYGMSGGENDHLTELVDHVDTERNAIVFINQKGREFELRLVDTFAPSTESARSWLRQSPLNWLKTKLTDYLP